MGMLFNTPDPGTPPPPPPPPPAANPPTYASSQVQGSKRGRAAGVPGFGNTVKTDAIGGPTGTTEQKQLMGG